MYKSKLAIFIDSIVISSITLILTFGWLNKILKNAKLSLFVSNIISFLLFIVVFITFYRKNKVSKISFQDTNFLGDCVKYLTYCSSKSQTNYLCKLLDATYINSNLFLSENYYFYISINTELNANDFYVANQFMLTNNDSRELIFLGLSANESFSTLLTNSPIKYNLFLKEDLYTLIKTKNFYPITRQQKIFTVNKFPEKTKKFFKALTKNKFKNLFFSGLSITLLSFFVPYNLLYLTIGSFLLILSALSLINKNKPSTKSKLSASDILKK